MMARPACVRQRESESRAETGKVRSVMDREQKPAQPRSDMRGQIEVRRAAVPVRRELPHATPRAKLIRTTPDRDRTHSHGFIKSRGKRTGAAVGSPKADIPRDTHRPAWAMPPHHTDTHRATEPLHTPGRAFNATPRRVLTSQRARHGGEAGKRNCHVPNCVSAVERDRRLRVPASRRRRLNAQRSGLRGAWVVHRLATGHWGLARSRESVNSL